MYTDDVQLYTSTPEENIDPRLDYINRDLVRIDNCATANGLLSRNVLYFREPKVRL